VDPAALSDAAFDWMYTCGNKQCRGVVQSSLFSFEIYETGTYRIHLIRNADNGPFSAYASTMEFEVVGSRLDCPQTWDAEDMDAEDLPLQP
jgi:hypothetical protein